MFTTGEPQVGQNPRLTVLPESDFRSKNLSSPVSATASAGTTNDEGTLKWIDIHHGEATKGTAIDVMRTELGATRVLCFGDNVNDLSMFLAADEAYAPANATDEIRAAATAVIGHHDEDGIARFLRERFALG